MATFINKKFDDKLLDIYNNYQLNNFFFNLDKIINNNFDSNSNTFDFSIYSKSKFKSNYIPDINIEIYDELNIIQLKDISKQCNDLEIVINTTKENLLFFYNLLLNNGITEFEIIKDYTEWIKDKTDSGIILPTRLIEYIKKSTNIRISCLIMMYFVQFYINIYYKLIINNEYNDTKLITLMKNNLSEFIGIPVNKIDLSDCNIYNCYLDNLFGIAISESILPGGYTRFPMSNMRIPRINRTPYKIKYNNIYPTLTEYEKEYLTTKNWTIDDPNNNLHTPGAEIYQVDVNHYFYKLAKKYNQFILTGPSGATDILFHVFGLNKNFNVEVFSL